MSKRLIVSLCASPRHLLSSLRPAADQPKPAEDQPESVARCGALPARDYGAMRST